MSAINRNIACLHPDPDLPDPKRMDRFRAKAGLLVARVYREKRLEEQRAERQRVRELSLSQSSGPDGEDHGLDLGPAALARPSQIERVGGRLSGAGQKDAKPIYARMIDASTLFERLHSVSQISDRQAKAGHKLWQLKRAAGIEARITARYPVVHDQPDTLDEEGEVIESACPEGYDARTYHRLVLRQLPSQMAGLLDAACDWTPEHRVGHPGVRFLATFQEGLTRLADLWAISE